MLVKLLNWFKGLFFKGKPFNHKISSKAYFYDYEFIEDVPDKIKSGIFYLIENQGYCWQSVMECPCGCKAPLYMNHVEDFEPNWSYKINEKNKISLYPSINRMVGCKSHFWLIDGKIKWT